MNDTGVKGARQQDFSMAERGQENRPYQTGFYGSDARYDLRGGLRSEEGRRSNQIGDRDEGLLEERMERGELQDLSGDEGQRDRSSRRESSDYPNLSNIQTPVIRREEEVERGECAKEGTREDQCQGAGSMQFPTLPGMGQVPGMDNFFSQFMQAQMQLMNHQAKINEEARRAQWHEEKMRREDWEKRQEKKAGSTRDEEWEYRQNMTMLSSLPSLSPTDDLESYLEKLEAHLTQCAVPEQR